MGNKQSVPKEDQPSPSLKLEKPQDNSVPEVYYIQVKEPKEAAGKKENSRWRKIREARESLGPKATEFFQGFKTGVMMGSAFGFIWGGFYAIRYKQFLMLPMSMASSALFFGGIVSFGSLIRSEEVVPFDFSQSDREFWMSKFEVQRTFLK